MDHDAPDPASGGVGGEGGGGEEGGVAAAPAVKNNKKYRKPKPWDTDGARPRDARNCAAGC